MKEHDEKADSTKALEPDRLGPRHRALMRRLAAGMRLQEACDDLGFSISRASLVVNSPLFKAEMEKMQADLNKGFVDAEGEKISMSTDPTRIALSDAAEIAARTLRGALDDVNPAVRVSAAKDILDRTGYAKEDKIKAKILVEPSQSLIDVLARVVKETSLETVNE